MYEQNQARSQGFEKGVRSFPSTIILSNEVLKGVCAGWNVPLLQLEGFGVLSLENFENETLTPVFW
ncbi:hypothetical protein DPMN_004367 [Dreissena polymorpha]|uniref:Uncharacterized protein n=1 Tax=Dreissena polymorpha TaxID=45954 RepID=A0A9D4RVL9_DREPO|nr:hypothetical protein DPMN_004367 [Dreissena polymorpha]